MDDALKLEGLAPEGVVSAVASSRPHHLRPPVPQDRVSCKEKDGHELLYICMVVFQPARLLRQLLFWGFSQTRRERTVQTRSPHAEKEFVTSSWTTDAARHVSE